MQSSIPQPATSFRWIKPLAAFALVFGVMTVFSGGKVLFGPAEAQAWAGNYIGFIVWFNFLAGFTYIVAAIGVWQGKLWGGWLASTIAVATLIAGFGFAFMVMRGTAFEMRTVGALSFRFVFWAVIALMSARAVRRA